MIGENKLVKYILSWQDPEHCLSLLKLKVNVIIEHNEKKLNIKINRPYSIIDEDSWRKKILEFIGLKVDFEFELYLNKEISSKLTVSGAKHPEIKNIIPILSGKGGVGKSTITSNLAASLVCQGFKVGVLDADIHGPSQTLMLGSTEYCKKDNEKIIPMKCNDIDVVSIGSMLQSGTAIAWRGPMASKALLQLYNQTNWSNLDFLLIDCPPGTSDVLLTISKQIPIVGAVLVTTPDVAAVMDAERSGDLLQKLSVPILGVVENMSHQVCKACGHVENTFGIGGGDFLAEKFNSTCWLKIPLNYKICSAAETGTPLAINDMFLQKLGVKFTFSLLHLPKYNKLARMNVEVKKDSR